MASISPILVALALLTPLVPLDAGPILQKGPEPTPQAILLADGTRLVADIPYPVVTDPEGTRSRLQLPDGSGGRVDPPLLDVIALARAGKLASDGSVPVIVEADDAGAAAALARLDGGKRLGALPYVAGRTTLRDLPALAALPGVARVHLDGDAKVTLVGVGSAEAPPPAPRAAVGASGPALLGESVTIAIIDTGVDHTHPDLGGCFGEGCKVIGGYDLVNDDADPMDDMGHGTHVASIAAGLSGVAPDARILAYKVCDASGSCRVSHVISAIQMAVEAGADVISMSLGGPGHSDGPLARAADQATYSGAVVVSSAGNSGPYEASIGEPAAAREGLAVGAIDAYDHLAYFSSRGPARGWDGGYSVVKPDLLALGVDVVAAVPTGSCLLCDPSGWRALSGTSMAAPHVSGAAALLLAERPDWNARAVRAALGAGARSLGLDVLSEGAGVVDVQGALEAELGFTTPVVFGGVDPTGRASYDHRIPLRVVNLGPRVLHVHASGEAEGVTLRGEGQLHPLATPVPPGKERTINLHVLIDNARVADGWHTVPLTLHATVLTPPEVPSDEPPVVVPWDVAFFKTGILRVESAGALVALQARGSGATHWGDVGLIYTPPDTFDGFAKWWRDHAFIEGLEHTGETNYTVRRPASARTLVAEYRFEDGDRLRPWSLPDCEPETRARCRGGGGAQLILAGSNLGYASWSTGPFDRASFGPTNLSWSYGMYDQYRDANATYVARAGGPLASLPEDLTPAPVFTEHAWRLTPAGGGANATRLNFCTSGGFSFAPDAKLVAAGERDRFVVVGEDVPPANGWHGTNCAFSRPYLVEGDPWTGLWTEPIPVYLTTAGATPMDTPWNMGAFDLRHATRDGDLLFAAGAPVYVGRIESIGWGDGLDVVLRYGPNPWAPISPAAGGYTDALYRDTGTTWWRVDFEGQTIAGGELAAGALQKRADVPGPGRVDVSLGIRDAPFEGGTTSMTYAAAFDAGERPIRVDWIRVTDGGDLATRMGAGTAPAAHVKATHPDGLAFEVDLVVRGGEEELRFEALAPGADGLVHVELPTLGAGAYELEATARAVDGSQARLLQTPAFVVEA